MTHREKTLRLGQMHVTLHRTVRVAEGRAAANLPPSLGRMQTYAVKDYRKRCPGLWEDEGVFVGLHDKEALWLSFDTLVPVALLVGAGAVNALTGTVLGTRLEKDNYLVTPPQPWLDGWKADDGTVYQFVATAFDKGKGHTVAEQLIGEKSQTGGIGIALFESKDPLHPKVLPRPGVAGIHEPLSMPMMGACTSSSVITRSAASSGVRRAHVPFSEMGLGKGGRITQKVYEDPYGLDVWKTTPSQTMAIYIVHAELLAELTGLPIAPPVSQESYQGHYFGLHDTDEKDIAGTDKFTGLKSVFAGAEYFQKE